MLRPESLSTEHQVCCECGAESFCENAPSRRAGVAADVAAHSTVADCAFGWFVGENSSFAFCFDLRLAARVLANSGKRNDPRAKICVIDTSRSSRFGQQARFRHSWN